jgi:hypothetical protein
MTGAKSPADLTSMSDQTSFAARTAPLPSPSSCTFYIYQKSAGLNKIV